MRPDTGVDQLDLASCPVPTSKHLGRVELTTVPRNLPPGPPQEILLNAHFSSEVVRAGKPAPILPPAYGYTGMEVRPLPVEPEDSLT